MAKKTTSRSNAEPKPDAAQAPEQASKPRSRARGAKPQQQGQPPVALADDRATNVAERNEAATSMSMSGMGDTPDADASTSMSMGSEPSEQDIRMRAYHRYLERGGGHGLDFDDLVEAERELRETKPRA